LAIHEDKIKGVYVKGLKEIYVANSEEVYDVMRIGGNNRVVAYTSK
jgi:kinesin family protein 5